ncbi:MAG: hypothetical protein HYY89_05155 [candidate division NC10 bacterium]|nr:hypothetical protein [candidate division NC10 bacterium]
MTPAASFMVIALLPAADTGAAAPPGLALEGLRRVAALPEVLFPGK